MFREEIVLKHVEGKRVLDCGGVDHDAFAEKCASGEWLHALICGRARECIGIDILEENVKKINQTGKYRFQCANAEELPFESEFDVLVAGELVEHLYNMGRFLDSAWKSLKKDAVLIITTPNASSLTGMIYAGLRRRELCHPEHTCYYSPQTLKYVVACHGFSIEELHLVPRTSKFRAIGWLRRLVSAAHPLLGDQIVLVARKQDRNDRKYAEKW